MLREYSHDQHPAEATSGSVLSLPAARGDSSVLALVPLPAKGLYKQLLE